MYIITTSDGSVYPYDYELLQIAQDRAMEIHKVHEDDPNQPWITQIHVEPKDRSFCGIVALTVFMGLRLTDDGGLRHMPPCTAGYALIQRMIGEQPFRGHLDPTLAQAIHDRMQAVHLNMERGHRVVEHVLRRRFDDLIVDAWRHNPEAVPPQFLEMAGKGLRYTPADAPQIPEVSIRALEQFRRDIAEGRINADGAPIITDSHRFSGGLSSDGVSQERSNEHPPQT